MVWEQEGVSEYHMLATLPQRFGIIPLLLFHIH